MRKKGILLLPLLLLAVLAAAQKKNVLFIGNSYTSANDLPSLVRQAAQSAGHDIVYESNTPGGCTFSQHCENRSMDLIRQGGWDIVVLQEQSQYPAFPQEQVENEVFPYAKRLVDSIRAHTAAVPMFYMTWGRRDGDRDNAANYPVLATYWGMDSMLYERYMQMKTSNRAAVCPVGRVWRYLRTCHPQVELYASDGSHPSPAGSYAAACAFFVMFFEEPASHITFLSSLDSLTATLIRRATDSVVYAKMEQWKMGGGTQVISGAEEQEGTLRIFPNPATTILMVECDSQGEAVLTDMMGRTVRRMTLTPGRTVVQLHGLPKGIYNLRSKGGYCRVVKR
ncbi:MAG: hypothetical protein SPJ13_08675 [Bacteroidales bacterium]|nr:hypothetical protein [Bacteroidales bacterium]